MPLLDEVFAPLLDELDDELEDETIVAVPYVPPPVRIIDNRWSWATFDARTYTPTGDVPMTTWSHEEQLSKPGSWSGVMQPPRDVMLARVALAATEPGKATIVPLRNGVPLGFDGFVGPGGRDVPHLAGGNVTATLDLRVVTGIRTYTAVDQLTVLADLVAYCAVNAGLLVETSFVGTSGVTITQTHGQMTGPKTVGGSIRENAAMANGFDWDIRTEILNDEPVRVLRAWFPRRGRYYIDQISPVFVVGGNVRTFPSIVASNAFRTQAAGYGEEIDPTTQQRLFQWTTSPLLAEGYLTMTAIVDKPDVTDLQELYDATVGEMRLYGSNPNTIELEVNPDDPAWPWGSWDLGDECRVVVPPGFSPWWPDGYSEIRRITAHRWSFDAAKGEALSITTERVG